MFFLDSTSTRLFAKGHYAKQFELFFGKQLFKNIS